MRPNARSLSALCLRSALALAAGCAAGDLDTAALDAPHERAVDLHPVLAPQDPPPSNLLVIAIDTLRRDALPRYGGADELPFLSSLLDASITLDDHHGSSNYTPSALLTFMTGQNSPDIGYQPNHFEMPGTIPTAIDAMREQGVFTAVASASDVPALLPGRFDVSAERDLGLELTYADADAVVAAARALTPELAGHDRWFAWLHFLDPHDPYLPPDDYLGGLDELPPTEWEFTGSEWHAARDAFDEMDPAEQDAFLQHAQARYRAEIRHLDDQLAALWDHLESEGALDDTLVVLWSDHGESFAEHASPDGQTIFGHGNSLYGAETRGVVAFWTPDLEPRRWAEPSCHADLMPTILREMRLDTGPLTPTGQALDMSHPGRCFAYAPTRDFGPQHAVVDGDWKLLYGWDGQLELYDLSADPHEQTDLSASHPERVEALWALLAPEIEKAQDLELAGVD